MRRPNKRLAQRAPVRVPLRCLAHYAVLHFKPLAAHAAMVNLPGPQLARHRAVAKRAPVNIFFGCHLAIFDIKPVTAGASMVNLPIRQLAGNSAFAKRAPVNIFFGCHLAILDIKPVTAGASMVNLPQSSACWRRGLRKTGNCKQTLWQRCVHLWLSPGSAAPHHPEASPMGATRARNSTLERGRRHQGVSPFIYIYIYLSLSQNICQNICQIQGQNMSHKIS